MLNFFSRFRSSIEWRLPAVACALLLLVTAALSWSAYLQVRRSTETAAVARLEGTANRIATQSGTQQVAAKADVRHRAGNAAVTAYFDAPAATRDAHEWPAARPILLPPDSSVSAVELWNISGRRLISNDTGLAAFVPGAMLAEVRATAIVDTAAVGRIVASHDTILFPVVSVVMRGGERLGYVVEWHRVKMNPKSRGQIANLFGEGAALYVGSSPGAWTDQADVITAPPIDTAQPGKAFRYDRSGSGARLGVAVPVNGAPWFVVMELSERAILAPARQFLNQMALIALGVFALALGATWAVSHHMTRPLRELTAAADARANGEYAARVPTQREDEFGRLASAFNSMADHVDAEVKSRTASEAQWRLLFRSNPHPMWVFDEVTLRFLAVNDAAVAKYGYSAEEFLSMTVLDIRPADDLPAARTAGAPLATDYGNGVRRHLTKAGTPIDIEINANAITFGGHAARLVLALDVTERRVLEAQLRQSQRMDAVGRLAGGVAHDFNNLLLVIMTYTQLLHDKAPDSDPSKAELASVLAAAERAQTLTRQLLALSRQQVLQPVIMDPNATLQNVQTVLRRVIGEDIVVNTELASDIGMVLVDPSQLEQVLLNLAVNARDAMPSGGRLTVSTSAVDLDEVGAALHGVTQAGRYVVISVADTGIGMTAELRSRIFDPFFTTKDVGKGTGLGLSIVYGIVTQSGGAVTVYSEPGLGTTFRVYLPRVDAPTAAATAAVKPRVVSGHEVVLVVEDEPSVRMATSHALEHLGYTVVAAQNGIDAIDVVGRHAGPLDLVISDVVMPEMDGPTLLARLRTSHPGLKALLVSGYSRDAVATRGFASASALFLQKPFSIALLSEKVREALDGRTTSFT